MLHETVEKLKQVAIWAESSTGSEHLQAIIEEKHEGSWASTEFLSAILLLSLAVVLEHR